MGPLPPILQLEHRTQRDSITDILRTLNWPTLQKHCQQARLVLLFKILNNFQAIPSSNLPAIIVEWHIGPKKELCVQFLISYAKSMKLSTQIVLQVILNFDIVPEQI